MNRASLICALAGLCGILPLPALAQGAPQTRSTQALSMLDGKWSGPAWVIAPDGQRYDMQQTETVCPAVFGQIRVMEGRGEASGSTRFHAITIFEGKPDGTIAMRSYTPGRTGEYALIPRADGFEWRHEMSGQAVRYVIRIDGDVWHEVGEKRNAQGDGWEQIFGMRLVRQTRKDEGCITPLDVEVAGR